MSLLLNLSVIALLVGLYLDYQRNFGKGRRDIY